MALLVPLVELADLFGVLAYATPASGTGGPSGTITSMQDLAPADLAALLPATFMASAFSLDLAARKGSLHGTGTGTNPNQLDFGYDVERSGQDVTYQIKGAVGAFGGYDVDFPALTVKVKAALPSISSTISFAKPGTLAIAGTTKLRIDALELPLTVPGSTTQSEGATFFSNHPYQFYHPEDCLTIKDDVVTLQNGTSAPLPH